MQALAVFRGGGPLCLRPFLMPGFGHCFAALNDGRAWIIVDLARDGLFVTADIAADFDLAGYYRGRGMTVVETHQAGPVVRYAFGPLTCVGAVKRVLRVSCPAATPWQLYRFLTA